MKKLSLFLLLLCLGCGLPAQIQEDISEVDCSNYDMKPKWHDTTPNVTFSLADPGEIADFDETLAMLRRAAGVWNDLGYGPLLEIRDDPWTDPVTIERDWPNIIIAQHGEGGGRAHTYSDGNGRIRRADMALWPQVGEHIDRIESIVVHEFGHILGMGHLDTPGTIMYPTVAPGTTVKTEDVEWVRCKYDESVR